MRIKGGVRNDGFPLKFLIEVSRIFYNVSVQARISYFVSYKNQNYLIIVLTIVCSM